jgi:hypothetical protein
MVWTGLNWFRTGTKVKTFGFLKMLRYCVAVQMAVYLEGLDSMELVL